MIDQKLIDYIKTAQKQGNSDELIRQALQASGWQETQITEALAIAKLQNNAPLAPSAHPSVPPSSAPIHPAGTFHAVRPATPRKPRFNSPYSVLLAIVLFVSLLILVSQVISDINSNVKYDTSFQLVLDAIVILPMLLIAFALQFSFSEDKQKYLILSQPYYLVAGWLLLRLLFHVSGYILDQDTVYGVYVVLIMVIAVLTGIIFVVQKYVRK